MTERLFPPHGGYKNLLSYRKAEIVYDATVDFCARFLNKRDRTYDQMVQAARSGKQNIIEGSQASGTSKQTEITLTNVARASLEELLARIIADETPFPLLAEPKAVLHAIPMAAAYPATPLDIAAIEQATTGISFFGVHRYEQRLNLDGVL